ncbi:MAG: hypothetical protein UU09_C0011G0004 [Microgenomates group bacterium GW2011_GWA2_40_6]|nr:MAG: hypothetical protein UU09_C0011G0004 [Microgenomates group bacterium GW2011_GWA2_40_6]
MVTNTRLSLRLDKKTIAEIKQKAVAEGKSISKFIVDSKDYYDFVVNDNISIRVDYINPVSVGSEIYRIDIFFKEQNSERLLRPLWYELWVLQDCVEDNLHTSQSPKRTDFAEYAYRFIMMRFKESNNLPAEYGAFIWPNRTPKFAKNRQELWMWLDEAIRQKQPI